MKQIVISKCSGRFANQLWMFANVLTFALEHDYEVSAPSFLNYANKFTYWNNSKLISVPAVKSETPNETQRKLLYYKNTLGLAHFGKLKVKLEALTLSSKVTSKLLKLFVKQEPLTRLYFEKPEYAEIVNKILKKDTVVFEGFMFCSSIDQMQKHGNALREIFKPQQAVLQKMDWLKKQRLPASIIIGVHIRRGDYKSYRNGKYYYDLEIYKKQMQHLANMYADKNPSFFICSDEVFTNYSFSDFKIIENENGNATEDLYLMSTCDYLIAPPSTFSKWASFYGEVPLYVIEEATDLPAAKDFVIRYNHYY
jgi:hypothetical protein